MTVFHRCKSTSRGHFYSSEEQDTRDVLYAKFPKPLGFAIASNGTACISWDSGCYEPRCRVWLVWRNDSLMQSSNYGRYSCFLTCYCRLHNLCRLVLKHCRLLAADDRGYRHSFHGHAVRYSIRGKGQENASLPTRESRASLPYTAWI